MAKRHFEKIMLSICILAFFIFAPVLLFYALGYKYNLENNRLIKTGGVFITFWPDNANVYIDGVLQQKRYRLDFTKGLEQIIQRENLIPGNHKVEISLYDYRDWEKEIRIEESKVTTIKNIILFPEKFIENKTTDFKNSEIQNLTLSPKEDKFIFTVYAITDDKNTKCQIYEIWQLNLNNNKLQMILDNDTLMRVLKLNVKNAKIKINKLIWSPDEAKILCNIILNGEEKWVITDILSDQTQLLFEEPQKTKKEQPANNLLWNPDGNNILFLKNNNLYIKNINDNLFPKIILNGVTGYALKDNDIYFINNQLLYKANMTDLADKNGIYAQLSNNTLPDQKLENSEQENKYAQIIISGRYDIFVLDRENVLYYLDKNKTFAPIGNNVTETALSLNNNAIAYSTRYEIWVYYLKNDIYLKKIKNTSELIARYSADISLLGWLQDSDHLIFMAEGQIKIAEIDNRDYRQILNLTEQGYVKEFAHKNEKDSLYFINAAEKSKNIYSFEIKKR